MFMKTLKYEELFRSEYRDLREAHLSIREFLEKNLQRKAASLRARLCAASGIRSQSGSTTKEAATRRLSA
jgi:hypothetical protein